jgi:ribonuclease HI
MLADRHNKIALRILKGIQNAQKQLKIKWIPAHFGNERADILAKDGVRNGMPIQYSQKLKDVYRILEETQREEWNNRYVLKVAPKIEPEP